MSFNLLVLTCLAYVALLFAVASVAERSAEEGRAGWLRSPLVYTLSLSVYCTAWTFYGAVGYAARSGLEFMTIYLGPTLVFVGWWVMLRKLVRIGRENRVTSIADFISSRYGKSNLLGVIVTLLCISAGTPYIALQLQSIAQSFTVFATDLDSAPVAGDRSLIALWVAMGLAFFTIVFGTRNLDANEQHHGVVTAIALEAVVKLVALLAVGIFVVWGVAGGPADALARISAQALPEWQIQPGALDRAYLAFGHRDPDPAAHVSGAGGRKCGRQASGHGKLGLPGLSVRHQPVRSADCGHRYAAYARRRQSRYVRDDPAAASGAR